MPRLRLRFGFEQGVLKVGQKLIRPLQDAVNRWEVRVEAGYRICGPTFLILYQLREDQFLHVEYSCCDSEVSTHWWRPIEVIRSDYSPQARMISRKEAVDFLFKEGFDVPKELEKHLLEESPKRSKKSGQASPPREFTHWKGKELLGVEGRKSATDADPLYDVNQILSCGTMAVQDLKKRKGILDGDRFSWDAFIGRLFSRYRVPSDEWWGSWESVPPTHVGIHELKWPGADVAIRDTIVRLQDFMEGPAGVLSWIPLPKEYVATDEEKRLAKSYLQANLGEMEALICQLQKAVTAYSAGRVANESAESIVAEEPSEDEIWLYRLYFFTGKTQKQLAEEFVSRHSRPMNQGQVSKALKSVRSWIEAGNLLPGLDWERRPEVNHMSPDKLDLGHRIEGHTKRQRDLQNNRDD